MKYDNNNLIAIFYSVLVCVVCVRLKGYLFILSKIKLIMMIIFYYYYYLLCLILIGMILRAMTTMIFTYRRKFRSQTSDNMDR